MSTLFFITHPDVVIDPTIPITDWPLSERGQARMLALVARPWIRQVHHVFASSERKARDAAQMLTDGLGLDFYRVIVDFGENDRSATGFLPKEEFEATADAFFGHPQQSIWGWEPAAHAQARIVRAIEQIVLQVPEGEDIAVV